MTPTEQDDELRERIGGLIREAHASGYILGTWAHPNIPGDNSIEPSNPEDITEQTLELITADRKRVELEARIDELKMWELPENEIQMVFADPCNICGHDYPKLRKAQQDRLSALKAQQEQTELREKVGRDE